tara:strand:+ start:68 stop:484 length:417 start_codon:yes stop_codon:yes gene_type:complete
VKLKELRNNDPSLDLTKVDFGETENIWVSDYWDGAISGMIEYQNELYWFEMTQENEEWKEGEWYRRFAILALSKEQLEKEFKVHEDFQRFVGTHYDGKQLRRPPKLEEGKMSEFYDKHSEYVKSRPFEDNEVIGWMEN